MNKYRLLSNNPRNGNNPFPHLIRPDLDDVLFYYTIFEDYLKDVIIRVISPFQES